MHKINIKKDFSNDWITRIAGEKLRQMILAADDKKEKVEIDFDGAIIASTSFFDEGFAKLAQAGWTFEKLNSNIILKNIHPKDKLLLEKMCRGRDMK